jgi:exodeoxyribonuclease V alpha subunit
MSYLNAPDLNSAYRIFAGFRILCSHRRGRYGVETMNYYIENQIRQNIAHRNGFYRGRPIIIRQNAPDKKLYNGDIGLTWTDENGNLKVFFPAVDKAGNESFFAVEPCNLPEYEAAFAMTIHKAQGTGFQKVLIILTPESRLLTRELLYTGITRAERNVEMWTETSSIANALLTPTRRRSGLRHRLI